MVIKEPELEEELSSRKVSQDDSLLNKKRKVSENGEKNATGDQVKLYERKQKKKDKQKEKKLNKWYHAKINTNIYVTGLPKEVNEMDLVNMFTKCGFIRKDEKTGKYKVKLYKDENGVSKGDGLISFLREESVELAIDLFNNYEIKPGCKIVVEKAKFEQKGDYKAREMTKIDDIQRYKHKTDIDRMLGWDDDDLKGLKIVVLKNMFNPDEFNVSYYNIRKTQV
jgi:HIV Tat-specific factor 1